MLMLLNTAYEWHQGRARYIQTTSDYAGLVAAKNPDWYLPLRETGGVTAAAEAGPSGAYVNGPQLGVAPIAAQDDPQLGHSVGLSGGQHITCPSPLTGPDLTIDMVVQLDTISLSKQILVAMPGTAAGSFSVEVLTDGQLRAYSYTSESGTFHAFTSATGVVSQGTAHKITYERQSGSAPAQRLLVDGVEVAEDDNSRTHDAVPAGDLYVGVWSTGVSPMDGLIAHLAGWNDVVDVSDLALTQSVAWAVDIDAGTIPAEDDTVISAMQGGWHGKTPIVVTAGNGSLVTTAEDADEITVTSGATPGSDSFTYSFVDANTNTSPTATVSIGVSGAQAAVASWPLDEAFGATVVDDAVGSANGTYVGNPQKSVPAIVSGASAALALDGWRDYVQISHVAALAVSTGTICGYAQAHTLGWDQTLIQKGSTFAISITPNGRLRSLLGGITLESPTDFAIDAGKAFFFALAFGTGGMKLYLRVAGGSLALVASNASTAGLSANTSTLLFGTDTTSEYRRRCHAFMASVQLYNTALAQATLGAFAAPATTNVYKEDRSYWGWAVGQFGHGGGAANSTMNQTKNGYMFTALRTGTIDKWMIHLRQDEDGVGYSLGDGGTYRVSLCPINPANDDPDETQKQILYANWFPGNAHTSNNLIVTAQTPRSVVRGRRYFFMLENISGSPSGNFSSLNVNQTGRLGDSVDPGSINRVFDAENSVPGLSWFRGISLPAMWRGTGFSRFRGIPLTFALRYGSDANWCGSCMGIGARRSQDEDDLFGSQRVARITWTQPWTGQADGIFINVHKWGSPGALEFVLKEDSETLKSVSVAASEFSEGFHPDFGASKSGTGGPVKWVFAPFTALQTLTADVEYTIEIRSPTSPNSSNCYVLAGIVNHQWNNPTFPITKECWQAVGGVGACDFSENNGSTRIFFAHHSTNPASKFRDDHTELPVCVRFVPQA